MSLSEYLLREIVVLAARPTLEEILSEIKADGPVPVQEPAAYVIRAERDARWLRRYALRGELPAERLSRAIWRLSALPIHRHSHELLMDLAVSSGTTLQCTTRCSLRSRRHSTHRSSPAMRRWPPARATPPP